MAAAKRHAFYDVGCPHFPDMCVCAQNDLYVHLHEYMQLNKKIAEEVFLLAHTFSTNSTQDGNLDQMAIRRERRCSIFYCVYIRAGCYWLYGPEPVNPSRENCHIITRPVMHWHERGSFQIMAPTLFIKVICWCLVVMALFFSRRTWEDLLTRFQGTGNLDELQRSRRANVPYRRLRRCLGVSIDDLTHWNEWIVNIKDTGRPASVSTLARYC
jgi:hypothetical protein